MSLEKSEFGSLLAELQSILPFSSLEAVKAIAKPSGCRSGSDVRSFILSFSKQDSQSLCNKADKFFSVLICLQEPFLRFHLANKQYQTCESAFSTKLQAYLKNETILSASQINGDRIVEFKFSKYKLIIEFFPKRPNLYVVDGENRILLCFNTISDSFYQLPVKQSPLESEARKTSSLEIERCYLEKELLYEKQGQEKLLEKRLQRLLQSKLVYENELKKSLLWQEKQHEGELLQANFFRLKRGLQQIEVLDWNQQDQPRILELNPLLDPKIEVTKRFKQAKKLRRAAEPLQKQLLHIQRELALIEIEQNKLNLATTVDEIAKPTLPNREKQQILRNLPYREFFTETGLKIWVGKNAKGNEKLTFSFARGSDWWLHVHDFPGAHVVLRLEKQQKEPDPESLLDAIQVALAFSSAKDAGVAEICITQVKFISRLRSGKVGQVGVSKHRIVQGRLDPIRFQNVKNRSRKSSEV